MREIYSFLRFAGRLANPFGHPSHVRTQVLVQQTCVNLHRLASPFGQDFTCGRTLSIHKQRQLYTSEINESCRKNDLIQPNPKSHLFRLLLLLLLLLKLLSLLFLSATPLFLFTSGTRLTKLLDISTKKYLITKSNSQADCRMVFEMTEQSMAWMETDYPEHANFRQKTKWRLEHLGALGSMGESAPFIG